LLTAGSLADSCGRRLMYLIGLVVFTCASALCGFAVSTLMLQLSRALQGAGGAIMFAVSLALRQSPLASRALPGVCCGVDALIRPDGYSAARR
jgi:MFS family permease